MLFLLQYLLLQHAAALLTIFLSRCEASESTVFEQLEIFFSDFLTMIVGEKNLGLEAESFQNLAPLSHPVLLDHLGSEY